MTGRLIVIEGPDGAGKSAQAAILAATIGAELHTEPTRSPIGGYIRAALRGEVSLDQNTLPLLFAADRQEHSVAIEAKRQAGVHIVCDRYRLSTWAYARASGCARWDWADGLSRFAATPDIVVVLDVPLDVCAERMRRRGSASIYETSEVQRRVHAAYADAFGTLDGARIERVDGTGAEVDVARRVLAAVRSRLGQDFPGVVSGPSVAAAVQEEALRRTAAAEDMILEAKGAL